MKNQNLSRHRVVKGAAALTLGCALVLGGTVPLYGAGPLASDTGTHLVQQAQGRTLTKTGNYFGFGNGMPSVSKSQRMSKAWISKGKLHVKGVLWRYKNDSASSAGYTRIKYKKGTYEFRLSKKCVFGTWDAELDRCSKNEFASGYLKGLKVPQLNIHVKRGKVVGLYAGA